jgi:hypothetical protein
MEKLIYTTWDLATDIFITKLSGKIKEERVNCWQASLANTLAATPAPFC